MEENNYPTDYFGKIIKVGDKIVYPGRRSSSLWMNDGIVVGFGERETYYGPEPTLKVRCNQYNYKRELKGTVNTTVSILSRVVIVQ